MILVELKLLTGRYHATPWGRNVNEGAVEWPPSPYRLARALVNVGKRHFPEWSDDRLASALVPLSGTPCMFLPRASFGHTRSFLSSNKTDSTNKQKIFDAFILVDPEDVIYLGFNDCIEEGALRDLDTLLRKLNYLGRSETWIEASVFADKNEKNEILWNCLPDVNEQDNSTKHEATRVACLLPPEEYDALPKKPAFNTWEGKLEKNCSWYQALCLTTEDLRQEGWSDPPVLLWKTYIRPRLSSFSRPPKRTTMRNRFNWARFELTSTVLPRIEETIPIAERVRAH